MPSFPRHFVLSGQDFVEALYGEGLKPAITLAGMVKKSDDGPSHILFAPANCDEWLGIPSSMIEKVEVVGKVPCKDHRHDYVVLYLSEPTDLLGKLLAYALRTYQDAEQVLQTLPGGTMNVCNQIPPPGWVVIGYFDQPTCGPGQKNAMTIFNTNGMSIGSTVNCCNQPVPPAGWVIDGYYTNPNCLAGLNNAMTIRRVS
jgi:hypothetical protein